MPMSKSGYTCLRYLFCWLNVVLWVGGCCVVGVGLWLRIAYEGYANLLPQYALVSADILTILVGVVMVILAFFGCCGSWCQNRCLLITYFSLVIMMIVSEFTIGSLAFVFRERVAHVLKEELRDGIRHHYIHTTNTNSTPQSPNNLHDIWDHLQTEFKCCGVTNYEDWFMIDAWPEQKWVAESCCYPAILFKGVAESQCSKAGNPDNWYPVGCYSKVYDWFMERLYIIGIVGLALAFLQLYGLISSMLLFCTVKHKRYSHTYKSYDMS